MALSPVVETIDAVPEPLRSAYVERDGKFHLDVEGLVPKSKLDEFRDTNIARGRELDELRKRYDGVDPDKFREYEARAAKERDKKLIDAGKVDELVNERVAAMRADHDKALSGLSEREKALTRQLEGLVIDGSLRDAAMKAGVRQTAIDDVLLRGRAVFKLENGAAIAYDGDKAMYGKSGDPVSVAEWVASLTERAPHLFDIANNGGGARNPTPGASSGGKTMTRAAFDALPASDKPAFFKAGGKITD